jgi:cell division protease FtsH
MNDLPPPPPPPPPGRGRGSKRPDEAADRRHGERTPSNKAKGNEFNADGTPSSGRGPGSWPRWTIWVLVGVLAAAFIVPSLWPSDSGESLEYSEWRTQVIEGNIATADINASGKITGEFTNGDKYTTSGGGPRGVSEADEQLLIDNEVAYKFTPASNNWLLGILSIFLPVMLIIGFFVWMQRRAQGQMGGVMSIGKSKAKAYDADRPSTTFDDIAGYTGVKQEITEVVDFLRMPERFREIGARVPKGILLVGPPGTGKTLFARAVAGEAGVGFLSVTGSDFMEMFVGVGASRVRDLFQQARRMGKAIIFVDEIDSIGRKRGAGLGGGHDEREQTLNQMLAEMDGFETSEGIVIMAATNRPDILDPALRGHQPSRHPRSSSPAPRSLRPPDRGATARGIRAPGDPRGPQSRQAHRPRRRHGDDGPGHARHVRCRPRQSGQRGRARRRSSGLQADRADRLRERPRPGGARSDP